MRMELPSAWSQVAAFVAAVDAGMSKWLTSEYGLGLTEYYAALHLDQASEGELRLNDLATKVGLNQSSVTRLIGRLEAKHLVFRDSCPDDGRGVYAALTDDGRALLTTIRGGFEARLRQEIHAVSSGLSPDERAFLAASISEVGGLTN